jgi:hypothetical protein
VNAILWFPIGAIILGVLAGAWMGGRSRDLGAGGGAIIGAFLALMFTFPFLALGLSNFS